MVDGDIFWINGDNVRIADRDTDRQGRKLRIVVRHRSLIGDELVAKGLARRR